MHDPTTQHPFEIIQGSVFTTPMYFVTAMVNADMARDLLLHNREPKVGEPSTNRKASKSLIKEYSLLMLSYQWYLSPQPIIFSDKAELSDKEHEEMIDGQQRLKALVLASQTRPDIEVPFVLCFDAPGAAKWLLDMGKKRGPGDFLRMQGEANSGQLANALRMLYALEEMRPFTSINIWRHAKLTPQMQSEFLNKHAGLRQGLDIARQMKALRMPHVGGVLFYLVSREYDPFKAQELFTGLTSGANLDTEDPRLKVREFIAALNVPVRGASKHKWDGFELLALLISATNAWLLGLENYKAGPVFNKLSSRHFPELVTKDQMPLTRVVPGNS